ncbi:hypothetical protein D9757_007013 [Collybiopsis confluens]|uniref:CN hydrolase domain-containing protein n=1 Tax=Collybiopsis confluens TaxID=2823264 RepID=A0A8H5M4A6_9AGAR|nr:hypothetical protein D9757_007013 [Collybiopsis confluens]
MSGYNFENAQAISPYLEMPRTGSTSKFCSETAKHLKCFVLAGYPEQLAGDTEETNTRDRIETQTHAHIIGANSAALYSPEGEQVGHYRKTNLFVTDKTWAKSGK